MHFKWTLAALAALCVATPAMAQSAAPAPAGCKPIQLINSVEMTPYGENYLLVPVSMNGTAKKMLLNTGTALSTVRASAAKALSLTTDDTSMKLLSGGGKATEKYAQIETLQVGRMVGKDVRMMMTGDPDDTSDPDIVGSLGPDMLQRYDIELDFASHKLNYFSPDHCPDQVIYWPAQVFAVIPFTQNRAVQQSLGFGGLQSSYDTHIRVPVTLDGKPFMATIITASTSSMTMDVAKTDFGVTADSPGSTLVDKNKPDGAFMHIFDSLTLDGITVTHPHIRVYEDQIGSKDRDNSFVTGSHTKRVDSTVSRSEVTIGMDVLKHLHLFVSFHDRKLYVTPASAPAAIAAPAATKP